MRHAHRRCRGQAPSVRSPRFYFRRAATAAFGDGIAVCNFWNRPCLFAPKRNFLGKLATSQGCDCALSWTWGPS
eukprot:8243594-Alexandrium_andersonii.AAC.1